MPLTNKQFQLLEQYFEELIDADPTIQQGRLEEIQREEPEVAAELRLLLEQRSRNQPIEELEAFVRNARAGSAELDDDAADAQTVAAPSTYRPRDDERTIGQYRLVRRLGAGGMGEVWEAEQKQPIERRVALKIIGRGVADPKTTARFLAERQALASMDHPHIAKVFDAGQTASGAPYLVMELVEGATTLTDYCRSQRLGLRERLELFAEVCDAVSHAHRKRIIHRDLKPSNILVTEVDGKAVPKVIDFGIAKPMEEAMGEEALTRHGDVIGTPQYMSPEQASLGALDVDTRSDVYTLGLLLYELLVGELPVPTTETKDISYYEILRRVREDEAPRASTALRRQSERAVRVQSPTTWRTLQGDLDQILGKALAKDREQRYGSASELGEDLRRYLDDQPVLATPPSLRYQTRKFLRRHRVAAGFALIGAVGVLSALVGTSAGLVRARAAEAKALAAEEQAVTEARTAQRVSDFLEELLQEGNPERAQGATSVRELLELGEEKLRTELKDEPALRSRLLLTVGQAFRANGDYDRALELFDESLSLRESEHGRVSQPVERALSARSDLLQYAGRHEDALANAREQVEIATALFAEDSPERADSLLQLGMALWRVGDFDEALQTLQYSEELLAGHGEPFLQQRPRVLNNVAILHWQQGRYDEAARLYEEALAIQREVHGDRHPHVASTLNNLALAHLSAKNLEEALQAHLEALDIRREVFEGPHPDVAESLNNLSQVYMAMEDNEAAIEAVREALEMRRQFLEEPNDLIATSEYNLGVQLWRAGETEEARSLLLKALDAFKITLGSQHVNVSYPLVDLSEMARREERWEDAITYAREAVAAVKASLPADHPRQELVRQYLLRALDGQDSPATEAERAELRRQLDEETDSATSGSDG